MLTPLKLPPGIRDVGTALASKGRWRDCNFIRWVEGVMQPVGKWVRVSSDPLPGRVCGMLSVRSNSQSKYVVLGMHNGVMVFTDSSFTDITPDGFSEGYEITSQGDGFGAGLYNADEYGTPREGTVGVLLEANSWSFGRWGQFTVGVCISDGKVYSWNPGGPLDPPDEKMMLIANAPDLNRGLVVTNERHLMLLASGGNPRRIQWSAREDYNEWTPSALNLAGDLELETSGVIQAGVKVNDEILILSDTDVFSIRYVGQPYGYGQERVGVNCGVFGPHAAAVTNDFVVWMGIDGFYMYRGQIEPIPCDVWDFVFRNLNYVQRALICAGHNADYGEVWWFFPSAESNENDRYVIWNYREQWWGVGYLSRTFWLEKGVWDQPLAVGDDGHLYEHEIRFGGLGTQPRDAPYIESAPFEIGDGENVLAVTQLIPDKDSENVEALSYEFDVRFNPTLPSTTYGPYEVSPTGYIPVRFTGREMTLRVVVKDDTDWRLGVLRAEIKRGGKR